MKKIILILLLLLAACGDTRDSELRAESSSPQVGIGQVDPNRGPCNSGFTRKAPGVCLKNAAQLIVSGVTATACQSISIAGVPSTAKSIYITLTVTMVSFGAPGEISQQVVIYDPSDTTCSSSAAFSPEFGAYEQVAVAAGGNLSTVPIFLPVPFSSNLKLNVKRFSFAGSGAHFFDVTLNGYED